MEAFSSWLGAEESKQAGLAPHADPSLLSTAVEARLVDARKLFNRLNSKKKPKPAAPTPSAENATSGDADGEPEAGMAPSPEEQSVPEQGFQEHAARDEL